MSVVLDAESKFFPRDLLADCQSALLLFCSGRMGAADGHWVREAGLVDVTCVDWDPETLGPFEQEYPADWEYVLTDAWKFARGPEEGDTVTPADVFADRTWDLVTADMPSQYGGSQLGSLVDWCPLAERYVVATVMQPALDAHPDGIDQFIPDGWRERDLIRRADFMGGTYWLVLERA